MFMFIKTVSATVFDMIKTVYYDKSLIFVGATFREKLVSHHRAANEADYCFREKAALLLLTTNDLRPLEVYTHV